MSENDIIDTEIVLARIRDQILKENIRLTQHAQQEMAEEDITLGEVLHALVVGQLIENYPEHQRGPCCLVGGFTQNQRPLHVVCTTANDALIVITVYEPKPPKWITSTKRRLKNEM